MLVIQLVKLLKKMILLFMNQLFIQDATEKYVYQSLRKQSGLIFNKDFYCGYSPERINPGDKKHR